MASNIPDHDDRMKAYWTKFHEQIDLEAAAGNDNTLLTTLESNLYAYTAHCRGDMTPKDLDAGYHSLAYVTLQAAKNYDWENPKQEKMVLLLLQMKAIGGLTRHFTEPNGETRSEPAQTSNGARIWSDMPYFVDDFVEAWIRDGPSMPIVQKRNLAAFVARLVSVGFSDRLAGITLCLFRDVLETPQDYSTMAELAPVLEVWLNFAAFKLMSLSGSSYNEFGANVAALGPLAEGIGIESGGFSAARWKFWKKRLQDNYAGLPAGPMREEYGLIGRALNLWETMLMVEEYESLFF